MHFSSWEFFVAIKSQLIGYALRSVSIGHELHQHCLSDMGQMQRSYMTVSDKDRDALPYLWLLLAQYHTNATEKYRSAVDCSYLCRYEGGVERECLHVAGHALERRAHVSSRFTPQLSGCFLLQADSYGRGSLPANSYG